jgi:succinate dehydrogenase / fumarate reductase cytochrome b subunit
VQCAKFGQNTDQKVINARDWLVKQFQQAIQNKVGNKHTMAEGSSRPRPVQRPQFRNIHVSQILGYRLPLAGIVSILHRVSGALLFLLGLPFCLYLFQQSITSELSFEAYRAMVGHWFVKLVLLALIWGFLHHFCAGIRYLVLDMHIGTGKQQAQTSAKVVLVVSLILTLAIATKLFGVL